MRNSFASMVVSFFVLAFAPVWAEEPRRASSLPGGEAAVVFVAHDYGFSGPDRLPAGLTTVRIVNTGQDLHHVQFLKLLHGRSAADFREAIAANPNQLPAWVQYAGGPNAHLPGSVASAST